MAFLCGLFGRQRRQSFLKWQCCRCLRLNEHHEPTCTRGSRCQHRMCPCCRNVRVEGSFVLHVTGELIEARRPAPENEMPPGSSVPAAGRG